MNDPVSRAVAGPTLAEFLNARLDEDERHADTVGAVAWRTGYTAARVLREVAAKRAILYIHDADPKCAVCHDGGWDWEPEDWPCPTIRALAAVYSDHPDYLQEWKP